MIGSWQFAHLVMTLTFRPLFANRESRRARDRLRFGTGIVIPVFFEYFRKAYPTRLNQEHSRIYSILISSKISLFYVKMQSYYAQGFVGQVLLPVVAFGYRVRRS